MAIADRFDRGSAHGWVPLRGTQPWAAGPEGTGRSGNFLETRHTANRGHRVDLQASR